MSSRTTKVIVYAVGAISVAALASAITYTSGLETVRIEDRCDPDSFNAAVPSDPGAPPTCVPIDRGGTIEFDDFIQRTIENGGDPKWRFHKDEFHVKKGDSVNSTNIGGEFHTFTPVAEFGPGVVDVLNEAIGLPAGPPIQECIADATNPAGPFAATGVPPGTTGHTIQLNTKGTQKFQCCIHPWMHSEVEVRGK